MTLTQQETSHWPTQAITLTCRHIKSTLYISNNYVIITFYYIHKTGRLVIALYFFDKAFRAEGFYHIYE